MKITLSFSHDDGQPNPAARVSLEAPAAWQDLFGPPLIKAHMAGKDRLFYRVEFSTYYHEVEPVEIEIHGGAAR